MKTATFKQSWLEAIAFLSQAMQNRIILIVTRYQLTGELPAKMSKTILCAVRFIFAELGIDLTNVVNKPESKSEAHKDEEKAIEEVHETTEDSPAKVETPAPAVTPVATPRITLGKLPRKMKKAMKKALARKVA